LAALRDSSLENFSGGSIFSRTTTYRRKRRPRGAGRRPHAPQARAGLGRAWPTCGALLAPLLRPFWLQVPPVKIMTSAPFLVFFPKVEFLHKNETPGQFC
jgi:hypothetical protein